MAGKGDVLRPMAVDEMTGVWPERMTQPKPCDKCGRDTAKDERQKLVFANGELVPRCYPKCP
jgi:hypothetical protein